MSQFGCYTFDRMFCECGTCEACKHRLLMESERKSEEYKSRVQKAMEGFSQRVASGLYESQEEKREKAKQRSLEEKATKTQDRNLSLFT